MSSRSFISNHPFLRASVAWLVPVFLLINLALLLLSASDLFGLIVGGIGDYPFGWEGGGIVYRSSFTYIFSESLDLLVAIVALLSFHFRWPPRYFVLNGSLLYHLYFYLMILQPWNMG